MNAIRVKFGVRSPTRLSMRVGHLLSQLAGTALVLAFGPALAQSIQQPASSAKAPASQPVSTAAPVTKDGRAFANLTEAEVDVLPRAEKKLYYAWKNAELDAILAHKTKELAATEEKVAAEGERLLVDFLRLHANRSHPAFNASVYEEVRHTLRKLLERGSPSTLMKQLEVHRSILEQPYSSRLDR